MTIVTDKPRQHRTRTRRWTNPEVLRAVARFLERPHATNLGVPCVGYYEFSGNVSGCVCVTDLASLVAWTRAMDDIMSIVVTPDEHGTEVAVTGRVSGPVLKVFVSVYFREGQERPAGLSERREITVAELVALAEAAVA